MKIFAIGVKENGEQASFWTSQHGLTYPVSIDPEGEVYKKFGTGSLPYHVIIDRQFIIRYSEEKFEKDHLVQLLNSYLQNEPESSVKTGV